MKRRNYADAIKLDVDSMTVRLIPIVDESERAQQRSAEVVELAAELIRLASTRGRVKKFKEEAQDEAA